MNAEQRVLQMEGVLSKGYGCIAKFALLDPDLTITDKGLYAYLVSLAGGGLTTWPTRDTILRQLGISKSSYYASQKNLLANGYLRLEHQRKQGKWDRAVYTICLNPKKYQETPDAGGTMLASGYGLLPRMVMQDERINVKDKALYAYFVTFANVGSRAFPVQSTVGRDLGVSVTTFRAHLRKLMDCGYILFESHRRENGCYGASFYYIALHPFEGDARALEECIFPEPAAETTMQRKQDTVAETAMHRKQDTVFEAAKHEKQDTVSEATMHRKQDTVAETAVHEKQDTVKSSENPKFQGNQGSAMLTEKNDFPYLVAVQRKQDTVRTSEPCVDYGTQHSGRQKMGHGEPDAKKWDTVIGTLSNTTTSITKSNNTTLSSEEEDARAQPNEQQVKEAVRASGGIPEDFVGNANLTRMAIRSMLSWNPYAQDIGRDDRLAAAWETVVKAFEQLCTRPRSKVREEGEHKTVYREQVIDLFNARCVGEAFGDYYADEFFEWLAVEYLDALEDREDNAKAQLESPMSYARFVIWTAMWRWTLKVEEDQVAEKLREQEMDQMSRIFAQMG